MFLSKKLIYTSVPEVICCMGEKFAVLCATHITDCLKPSSTLDNQCFNMAVRFCKMMNF